MKQGVEEFKVEEPPAEKVFEQSDDEDMEDEVDVNAPSDQTAEEKDPTRETISKTSRLFVRNLAFDCTEDELRGLFTPFGNIAQVSRQLYLRYYSVCSSFVHSFHHPCLGAYTSRHGRLQRDLNLNILPIPTVNYLQVSFCLPSHSALLRMKRLHRDIRAYGIADLCLGLR